jgi:hypothetical protein
MAIDTGHGATITFGTQGGTWRCIRIPGHAETRPVVDTTYLATTTTRTNMPGDLKECSTFTVQVQFQGNQGLPTLTTAETVTITHPLASGGATAATVAGTGYVTRRKYPDMETNALQVAEFDIQWDGGTGPTFTAAT